MDRFEILKANTIQFTVDLDKSNLSDFLIEEIYEADEAFKKEVILQKILKSKDDIKELKEFLVKNKKKLKGGLYSYCREELAELKDDIKWRATEAGKVIIEIEQWIAVARPRMERELHGIRVFVGRSFSDPQELIMGGIIKTKEEMRAVQEFLEREAPPVKPKLLFDKEY